MLCRDAQFYLRLRRHTHSSDELDADLAGELERHCGSCSQCSSDLRRALSFDRSVAAAMTAVAVPPTLRDKLLTQSLAFRGSVLRRRAYRVAALAASLMITVGLCYGLFTASRPVLDTDQLVRDADKQVQDPDGAIQSWLVAKHLPPQLPKPFNADLLVSLGSERILGRDVPMILFAAPANRGFAKVYIIRKDGDFKVDANLIRDAHASNTHAIVLADVPQSPNVVYVIIHTGHDLQPFLRYGPQA